MPWSVSCPSECGSMGISESSGISLRCRLAMSVCETRRSLVCLRSLMSCGSIGGSIDRQHQGRCRERIERQDRRAGTRSDVFSCLCVRYLSTNCSSRVPINVHGSPPCPALARAVYDGVRWPSQVLQTIACFAAKALVRERARAKFLIPLRKNPKVRQSRKLRFR
jgi:hypothetical protein